MCVCVYVCRCVCVCVCVYVVCVTSLSRAARSACSSAWIASCRTPSPSSPPYTLKMRSRIGPRHTGQVPFPGPTCDFTSASPHARHMLLCPHGETMVVAGASRQTTQSGSGACHLCGRACRISESECVTRTEAATTTIVQAEGVGDRIGPGTHQAKTTVAGGHWRCAASVSFGASLRCPR